jgi:putative addiction module killer protein
MIEVRKTAAFSDWMLNLRDHRARAKIAARIDRLAFGNPGDVQSVGRVSANCESIQAQATGFILCGGARR